MGTNRTALLNSRLGVIAEDPREFISRLKLVDEKGIERRFNTPFPEQVLALDDFMSPANTIIHYKPRQIGDTTVASAYNFGPQIPLERLLWQTYTKPRILSLESSSTSIGVFLKP